MNKRQRILALIETGMTNAEIVTEVGCTTKYVRGERHDLRKKALGLRSKDRLSGHTEQLQPTYATPRPCGPFEELAWKVREREARRRELVLGMLA